MNTKPKMQLSFLHKLEFIDAMQCYRICPPIDQERVVKRFEEVKYIITDKVMVEMKEVAMIAAVIGNNMMEAMINVRNGSSIEAYDLIGDVSREFYKKFKDVDDWHEEVILNPTKWGFTEEDNPCDWEVCVVIFAQNRIK